MLRVMGNHVEGDEQPIVDEFKGNLERSDSVNDVTVDMCSFKEKFKRGNMFRKGIESGFDDLHMNKEVGIMIVEKEYYMYIKTKWKYLLLLIISHHLDTLHLPIRILKFFPPSISLISQVSCN